MYSFFTGLAADFTAHLAAQLVGVVAIIFYVLSYQSDNNRITILMQLFSSAIFAIHFFMLGASSGGVINIFGALSNFVFFFRAKKKWADNILWPIFFVIVSTVITLCTSKDGWWMIVPIASFAFSRASLFSRTSPMTRKFAVPAAASFLVYNIHFLSYAGIVAEVFSLTSLTIAVIRFDILKRDDPKATQTK